MSSEDEFTKPTVLPVRHGGDTGKSRERTQFEGGDTTQPFRTSFRTEGDTETMMRTRNGFVEYTSVTKGSPNEPCIRGPFVERSPESGVSYDTRSVYEGMVIHNWDNTVELPITPQRHVILENAMGKKLKFLFKYGQEPEPTGTHRADVTFSEVARTYHPEADSLAIPHRYSDNVFARFKAVIAPIKKLVCKGGKTVSFAAPATDGTNGVAQGCIGKRLAESYAKTRAYDAVGWLKRIFLRTGSGGMAATFIDGKGFLSPITDKLVGADNYLACTDIPAIGTRVLGIRFKDVVFLNGGEIRPARDYEKATSPSLFWLRPRNSPATVDEFGNVAGFLWRPTNDIANRGPDVCVESTRKKAFGPSFFRFNADDSPWLVQVSLYNTTPSSTPGSPLPRYSAALYVSQSPMDGVGTSQSDHFDIDCTNSLGDTSLPGVAAAPWFWYWGTMTDADPVVVIGDVTKHGDRALVFIINGDTTTAPIGEFRGGSAPTVQAAFEITITGSAPSATVSMVELWGTLASGEWANPKTRENRIGAYYDDSDTLQIVTNKLWEPSSPPEESQGYQFIAPKVFVSYGYSIATPNGPINGPYHCLVNGVKTQFDRPTLGNGLDGRSLVPYRNPVTGVVTFFDMLSPYTDPISGETVNPNSAWLSEVNFI